MGRQTVVYLCCTPARRDHEIKCRFQTLISYETRQTKFIRSNSSAHAIRPDSGRTEHMQIDQFDHTPTLNLDMGIQTVWRNDFGLDAAFLKPRKKGWREALFSGTVQHHPAIGWPEIEF